VELSADLRARLEAARLDLLALFRALDRMDLTPSEIPQRLIRQVIELDAAYVECSLGTGSTSRSLGREGYAPRYAGRFGTVTGSLHAIQEESFLRVLIPACPNWKSPFVRARSRPKPTAWSQGVIPYMFRSSAAAALEVGC
jgi:hypothetical protein